LEAADFGNVYKLSDTCHDAELYRPNHFSDIFKMTA